MTRLLLTGLTAIAVLCFAAPALAASAATLDGERLTHAAVTDVKSTCQYDLAHANAFITYTAIGTASGPYPGTFVESGTARLYTWGGASLVAVDATFTIDSPAGAIKGSKRFQYAQTVGTGTCDDVKLDSTLNATGVLYTAALPDGTVDQGLVDMIVSDVPASAGYSASFRSTGRVVDSDGDTYADPVDNCPYYANADQADGDSDGIGDVCDPLDDRTMPLLQDLLAATKAAGVGKTLESKVQHAITSFDRGDDKGACADISSYIDTVRSRRGKSIPVATADMLIGKATHVHERMYCA